ncbi:unnamed protein product [Oppiella nova]|uniref:Uncharacterized protein n=1 Tax=Oppiella nova TaxID=334625 RepID=A0A7R9MBJ9_9ACAR|nr:unnamed protein product [Oppiella nova]CAG2174125.1 unnamed protein product [Oppiella nova]
MALRLAYALSGCLERRISCLMTMPVYSVRTYSRTIPSVDTPDSTGRPADISDTNYCLISGERNGRKK